MKFKLFDQKFMIMLSMDTVPIKEEIQLFRVRSISKFSLYSMNSFKGACPKIWNFHETGRYGHISDQYKYPRSHICVLFRGYRLNMNLL